LLVVFIQYPRLLIHMHSPVFTYGGQATTKPGVRASEHAIVYTSGYAPTAQPAETGMTKDPIPVDAPNNVAVLSAHSRINFGIHQPIQYNVKVKDLGMVPRNYIQNLVGYWQEEQ
jgi:hypothetical protein